jgi:hypothetical protein
VVAMATIIFAGTKNRGYSPAKWLRLLALAIRRRDCHPRGRFAVLCAALIDSRNQAPGVGAVVVILGAEVRAQQTFFRTDSRDERQKQ